MGKHQIVALHTMVNCSFPFFSVRWATRTRFAAWDFTVNRNAYVAAQSEVNVLVRMVLCEFMNGMNACWTESKKLSGSKLWRWNAPLDSCVEMGPKNNTSPKPFISLTSKASPIFDTTINFHHANCCSLTARSANLQEETQSLVNYDYEQDGEFNIGIK